MTTAALPDSIDAAGPRPGRDLYGSPLFAGALALTILATLFAAAYIHGGAPLATLVFVAGLVSIAGWLATARQGSHRRAAFDFHIATIVGLLPMYAEQWGGSYPSRVRQLFPDAFPSGVGLSDGAFIAVFPLGGSALLLLGALAHHHGSAMGRFSAWFTFAWAATAAAAVYGYPVFSGGHARMLPGAFTAPLPLLLALLGAWTLLRRDGRGA